MQLPCKGIYLSIHLLGGGGCGGGRATAVRRKKVDIGTGVGGW